MGSFIQFTEAAARRLKSVLKGAPGALRLTVEGGGCSGFQYRFALEDGAPQSDDTVIETAGARLIVDSVSAPFLEGAQVDYEDAFLAARFVVKNPNATASCGCGTSFAL